MHDARPLTYGALIDVPYAATHPTSYDGMVVAGNGITPAQHAMAFLTSSGEIFIANWATNNQPNLVGTSTAILGRIQLSRSRNIQLNRVELDGTESGTISIQASDDGRTISRVAPTVTVQQTADYRNVGCMVDCKNFNIVIEGKFNLSSVIVEALPTGRV